MSEKTVHTSRLWSHGDHTYLVWCPACKSGHVFPVRGAWSFNGDVERPTFAQSMRLYYTHPETKQEVTTCHFNVTAGRVIYHNDCPHAYCGQTIDMQDIPADYGFF